MSISPQRRHEIIDALRRGTVPESGLDAFATGLDRFEDVLDAELQSVKAGGSVFKAVRGEYGCGKTFFARWLSEWAKRLGFATAEVQVSETETPLHRLETVYRRMMERLATYKDLSQVEWAFRSMKPVDLKVRPILSLEGRSDSRPRLPVHAGVLRRMAYAWQVGRVVIRRSRT